MKTNMNSLYDHHEFSNRIFQDNSNCFWKIELPSDLFQKVATSDNNFYLLMLDVDNLTMLNSHYGRHIGDIVLATLANIIQANELVCFSGHVQGDTFYCLFHCINFKKAKNVAEAIRIDIQNYQWHTISSNLQVTCSIGITQLNPSEKMQDWVERTAAGMFLAKLDGRNCVKIGSKYPIKEKSRA